MMPIEEDKTSLYKRAVEILQEEGEKVRLYPEYSGRGMYGFSTPAIEGQNISDTMLAWAICVAGA